MKIIKIQTHNKIEYMQIVDTDIGSLYKVTKNINEATKFDNQQEIDKSLVRSGFNALPGKITTEDFIQEEKVIVEVFEEE